METNLKTQNLAKSVQQVQWRCVQNRQTNRQTDRQTQDSKLNNYHPITL